MSIFSRILDGSIPCHRVYEDDLTLAFLDINPLAPGHTLVIPKEAQATVMDLSEESAAGIGRVLPASPAPRCGGCSGMQHHSKQWCWCGAGSDACPFPCDSKIFRVRLAETMDAETAGGRRSRRDLRIMQASVGQE